MVLDLLEEPSDEGWIEVTTDQVGQFSRDLLCRVRDGSVRLSEWGVVILPRTDQEFFGSPA